MWSLESFRAPASGTTVGLGYFDGFHLGHRAIVERVRLGGLSPLVFTFSNHPWAVVDSKRLPELITTFEERAQKILQAGVDLVYTEFDRPFSQLEPDDFVRRILCDRLKATRVVVGPNYRYGHRARGSGASLTQGNGFAVEVVDPVYDGDSLISSTRIRSLIMDGDFPQVTRMLGGHFSISGLVQRGEARGRKLGFPTANLALPAGKVRPAFGVYAVRVRRDKELFGGVANLGVRPTFRGGGEPLLEVHLLDRDLDLYGNPLEVLFLEHLRPEQKFDAIAELRAQIQADIEAARLRLA